MTRVRAEKMLTFPAFVLQYESVEKMPTGETGCTAQLLGPGTRKHFSFKKELVPNLASQHYKACSVAEQKGELNKTKGSFLLINNTSRSCVTRHFPPSAIQL
ncbi:Hypothetical protein NTJ_00812 [Nesidiocoris tenuis]|uniref:Uncharacterized protein n=1 Tax=Nesidiocoris tenuis TaxID=355587 RepID=A0ABN7AAX0_9HEMI|nr:Hypothetical protein NTJ_00812 [Nesidiocoris tenuis]